MTSVQALQETQNAAAEGALVQLRAFLSQGGFNTNDRLPPERKLCETLGVTRSELRKAFAILEAEGAIYRQVGRGTFLGDGSQDETNTNIRNVAKRTTPREVMHSRLMFEPMLAKEAAYNATAQQMEAMRLNTQRAMNASSWREYETLDNQFHRLLAESCQNVPLLTLFDQLNALRRTVVWGRLRQRSERPPKDHHSFAEHMAVLEAIEERDGEAAQEAMRKHLQSVADKLFS